LSNAFCGTYTPGTKNPAIPTLFQLVSIATDLATTRPNGNTSR
jgi:hypothetical protein